MPEERPPPGTACIVDGCDVPATVYVPVSDSDWVTGDRSAPMCDEHATHWRDPTS